MLKLLLDRVVHIERVDKRCDALGSNRGVDAGKLLQGFVGLRITFATEYRLDSLGYHIPHVVEVAGYSGFIEEQLVESL